VTSPRDVIVREVTAQKLAFVGERLEVRARVTTHSMEEQKTTATLRANGEPVDEREVMVGGDHDQEWSSMSPRTSRRAETGSLPSVLGQEASKENNAAATTVAGDRQQISRAPHRAGAAVGFPLPPRLSPARSRLEVQCVMNQR